MPLGIFFIGAKFKKNGSIIEFSSYFYEIFSKMAIFQAHGASIYLKANTGVNVMNSQSGEQ